LNRTEALAVLHEIQATCSESVSLTQVSLDTKQEQPLESAFQIRIKGDLDVVSRQLIEIILAKHQIAMREEKGFLYIF
jgi:hypothetical protein